MAIAIIARVVAYGVPALLIVLGFIAYTGGKFAEMVFGSSEGMVALGLIMIAVGILIALLEVFIGVR